MGPPERFDSQQDLAGRRDNGNSKLLTVLLVVVALVAIVAIAIAAVALAKPAKSPVVNLSGQSSGQSGGGSPIYVNSGGSNGGSGGPPMSGGPSKGPNGKRTWNIAIGHDWGAHEYFDQKGYIQGFSKDLINAVCNAGNMDCYAIWAPYTDCWDSKPGEHPYGGQGLMDRWFDACTGWVPTTDRIHTLAFGMPYLKNVLSYFYIRKGANVDLTDLKNKKIGFMTGWFSDEKCLARAESSSNRNYVLTAEQVVYADTAEALVQLLKDNKIDAALSSLDSKEKYFNDIEEVSSPTIQCAQGGSTMMVRKDSAFLDEWNRAFQKLRSSGQFSKLCQESQANHELHGKIMCLD